MIMDVQQMYGIKNMFHYLVNERQYVLWKNEEIFVPEGKNLYDDNISGLAKKITN
jgi:hypothetical protein